MLCACGTEIKEISLRYTSIVDAITSRIFLVLNTLMGFKLIEQLNI